MLSVGTWCRKGLTYDNIMQGQLHNPQTYFATRQTLGALRTPEVQNSVWLGTGGLNLKGYPNQDDNSCSHSKSQAQKS